MSRPICQPSNCELSFHLLSYLYSPVLQYANVAQQTFASDKGSTLYLTIPALETLHKAQDAWSRRPKYAQFSTALSVAAAKLNKYYKKTTASPAYIMAICMFLVPSKISSDQAKQCLTQWRRWHTSRRIGQTIFKRRFMNVPRKLSIILHSLLNIDCVGNFSGTL